MTDDPSFDPLLLDQYLAGDASPADRARVEAWLRTRPVTAQLLRELPGVARGPAPSRTTDASWQALSARIGATAPTDDLASRREQVAMRQQSRRASGWLRRTSAIAAALLVMVGGVATWRAMHGGSLEAPLGRDVTATLPDGTRITLAAGSRATWSASFGKATRDIALTGQGYFDVVHDASRPFRVRSRDAVAEDVGTRFVVRAWPELSSVEVAVEEGLVALSDTLHPPTDRPTVLRAGERGQLVNGAVLVSDDADATLAWRRGELVFDNRPLTEVLPAISRRFDVTLVADSALANRRLSARFTAQSLDDVLNALALTLDVRFVTSGRSITLTPSVR